MHGECGASRSRAEIKEDKMPSTNNSECRAVAAAAVDTLICKLNNGKHSPKTVRKLTSKWRDDEE